MKNFIDERIVFSPETGHGVVAIEVARELGKESVKQTINPIESLKRINHPRKEALIEWINLSDENRDWYLQNAGKRVSLVTDGIMLLGDVFELNDEEAGEDGKGILENAGKSFFTWESAKKHAESIGKEMVYDWGRYIDFLPGSDENKIYFLQRVLGLDLSGFGLENNYKTYGRTPRTFKGLGKWGMYWGLKGNNDRVNRLVFGKDGIEISYINKIFFHRLRCLKKKQAK